MESLYRRQIISMELIDASCAESCHLPEAIRLINVALLCVQQKAGDRPNMSSVVLMMDSEGELMQPKKPSLETSPQLLLRMFTERY
ncbi:putative non-specific serine/threonine protein kinase [Helianthus anomalus]